MQKHIIHVVWSTQWEEYPFSLIIAQASLIIQILTPSVH